MHKIHQYELITKWTGNEGKGTLNYRAYKRSYTVSIKGKATISGSSDPAFLGDPQKHNSEELLLASLSSCHMLWYLHLCAEAGIVITYYEDHASALMVEESSGSGFFKEVHLHPKATIEHEHKIQEAISLHIKANQHCFIANSVKFPVYHHPQCNIP